MEFRIVASLSFLEPEHSEHHLAVIVVVALITLGMFGLLRGTTVAY
jgi:hypothetical protein